MRCAACGTIKDPEEFVSTRTGKTLVRCNYCMTEGRPSQAKFRDLGNMASHLPFEPFDRLLATYVKRAQTSLSSPTWTDEKRESIGTQVVYRRLGVFLRIAPEAVQKRLLRCKKSGQIHFDWADKMCYALGIHPKDLWPEEWEAGWSDDLATLRTAS